MNNECVFCNVEHKVLVPTVHMNGTSAHELFEQLQNAIVALREAARMIQRAAPNGRDFYPQAGSAIQDATSAHARRCAEIDRTITELTEQRDHVRAVLNFKAAQREGVRP